ncbi:UPF0193 protein EVG1 homolog [Condylostylus longicornis]|uniref:UPF0193 protein EVG1 homolog n=1 Tax=Condylostylus longicornis TaxID=2530218 RepID=UPI00244D9F6A|nr:UPF0193 protein EVG1 homolog [Condylostylus longicornis]
MDQKSSRSTKMEVEDMQWPSERVAKGGIYHPPKVQYSKETNDLLNLLMTESRLSMSLRKKLNYHLRQGDPLPLPEIKKPGRTEEEQIALEILQRAQNHKKRSLDIIRASGAYEQDRYRPPPNLRVPTDLAKLKLQETMCGHKLPLTHNKIKYRPSMYKKKQEEISYEEQIDEILQEIDERADWLAEMDQIGEGQKYRGLIQQQIASKLREIRALQRRMDDIEKLEKMKEIEDFNLKLKLRNQETAEKKEIIK